MLKSQVLNAFRLIAVTNCKRSYFTLPYVAKVARKANYLSIVRRRTQIENSSGKRYLWCVISINFYFIDMNFELEILLDDKQVVIY